MSKMKMFIPKCVLSAGLIVAFCGPAEAQHAGRTGKAARVYEAIDVDQIHFSITSSTAVTFDWIGTADQISYGTSTDSLSSSVSAFHPAFLPVAAPWVSDPGPYWEAKLADLQYSTLYCYRIGSVGPVLSFRTPPAPGTAGFRVCSTSDMHNTSLESVAMFNQIAELRPAVVLTTGDLTGAGPGGQERVGARFHDAMAWSQSAAWMPAWGNHDWEYSSIDDLRSYKGRFDIPNPGTISSSPAVSCCGEDWGWFDYGNTRFISCPERWTSSSRDEWKIQAQPIFSAAQNDPDISFIVTFGHRSSYTSARGRSPGETSLRTIFDDFHSSYSKYKLDVSGHNHQYERYQPSNGMTYVINSTAGAYYRGWDSPIKPSNCAYRAIHYGVVVLDISDSTIQGQFICSVDCSQSGSDYMPLEENVCNSPGTVIDAFAIPKSDGAAGIRDIGHQFPMEPDIKNYPNPFNPVTTISYSVPKAAAVSIDVYDLPGRKVATLVDGMKMPGAYTVVWSGKDAHGNDLASGLYIARLRSGSYVRSTKMLLAR